VEGSRLQSELTNGCTPAPARAFLIPLGTTNSLSPVCSTRVLSNAVILDVAKNISILLLVDSFPAEGSVLLSGLTGVLNPSPPVQDDVLVVIDEHGQS
jgi:hypothetical protein